jgi:hypothetical protein
MLIILTRINFLRYSLCLLLACAFASVALAGPAISRLQPHITVAVQERRVIARDKRANVTYQFDSRAAAMLVKAEEIRSVPHLKNAAGVFIIFVRSPSRPGSMGRGYCGAGYEDYLLLVELEKKILVFRDQFLLQSCLNGNLIYTDDGQDDPIKLLIRNDDGSLDFSWETDKPDQTHKLTVRNGRFVITLSRSDESP